MKEIKWWIFGGAIAFLMLLTAGCDLATDQPDGVDVEIDAEFTRTFFVSYKNDAMGEWKAVDINLDDLDLGKYGTRYRVIYEDTWDFDYADGLTEEEKSKIKLTSLNIVTDNKDGNDVMITNQREDGTSSNVDLTQFKGLSLITDDNTVIATVKEDNATKDKVYLTVKHDDLLKYINEGKAKVRVIAVDSATLPKLSDLDLAITVTTHMKIAQEVGHLIKGLNDKYGKKQ